METRIAALNIIVENPDSVEKINTIMHDYGNVEIIVKMIAIIVVFEKVIKM